MGNIVRSRRLKDYEMGCVAAVASLAALTSDAAGAAGSGITANATIANATGDALTGDAVATSSTVSASAAISCWSTFSAFGTLPRLCNQLEIRQVAVGNHDRLVMRI